MIHGCRTRLALPSLHHHQHNVLQSVHTTLFYKRVRVFYIHSLHLLSVSHLVRAVVVLMCHRYLRTDGERLDSLIRISLKRSTFSYTLLDHVSSTLVHFVLPLIDGTAGFVDMCTYLWYCFSAFEHMCEGFGNSAKLD